MNRSLSSALIAWVLAGSAIAVADSKTESTNPAAEPGGPLLLNQLILRPSLGEIFFNESDRFTSGVLLEIPALHASDFTLSIASGFLYSSLGNTVTQADPSSSYSVIQVPADLKLVVRPKSLPALSIGPHVGVGFVHSPSGLNAPFGSSGFVTVAQPGMSGSRSSSTWSAYPNVGGDADYLLSKELDLSLRYDSTLASAFNLQTLTLGLGITI